MINHAIKTLMRFKTAQTVVKIIATASLFVGLASVNVRAAQTCETVTLPAVIEAEKWCDMSGVQTESTTDVGGGINVGWLDVGDWLSYSINVPTTGDYKVTYRLAAPSSGGIVRLQNQAGSLVFGDTTVSATGAWQNWVDATKIVNLPAGAQNFSLLVRQAGFNVNWIKIELATPADLLAAENSSGPVSYPAGIKLNAPHTEPIPPKWMFGYMQSGWGEESFGYGTQDTFVDHARALRGLDNRYGKHRHPADVMVLDMYWNGVNWDWPKNMIWDLGRFPDRKKMVDDLHAMNFKLIMNYHSFGWGSEWLSRLRENLVLGEDAPWLDFWTGGSDNEKAVWSLISSVKGQDKRPTFMARHFARPNLRNHEAASGSGIGIVKMPDEDDIEKTMPVHWTGDVEGSWMGLSESIEGVVYSEDGASGGWSYLHTDTPGHSGGTEPELAARWIQFSDFTTTTRNHGYKPRDVWSWGPEVEKISYQSRMLRYRLLPYIYRSAWEIWETAMPMTRPLKIAFPGDRDDLRFEYMFGDSLLVAPVYKKAADFPGGKIPVYLPKGHEWVNYWTQAVTAGGQVVDANANDLAHVPLFVKRGAIIPMGPEIQWIDPTQHANPLTLDIYPLATGVSTAQLYDDDGETLAYQRGAKTISTVVVTNNSQGIAINLGAAVGSYSGQPINQTYILKVNLIDKAYSAVAIGTKRLTKVLDAATLLNNVQLNDVWALDEVSHILYVRTTVSTAVNTEVKLISGVDSWVVLDKTQIQLPQAGGQATANLSANVAWTVTNTSSDWLTVSPASGSNDGLLTFQAAANTSLAERRATVAVTGAGISTNMQIVQPGIAPIDIAQGKIFTASSTEASAYAPNNAFDGNVTTRWASAFADPQWIAVDLGSAHQINKIELVWEAAYAQAYKIQVSMDAINWTDIYATSTAKGGTESLSVSGIGRYVRMLGTQRATTWGYSLWEFHIYGAPTEVIPHTLNVNPSVWNPSASLSTIAINVSADVAWVVTSSQPWLTVTPQSGSGNGVLTLTASQNTGSTKRTAIVTLAGVVRSGPSQTIAVTQEGMVATADTYNIVSALGANPCMDVANGGLIDGTNIQIWTCTGVPAQVFSIKDMGNGTVSFVNPASNKCVDLSGGGTTNGTKVQLWTCNGTAAQVFKITAQNEIRNVSSNRCLDVVLANPANGTGVQLYDCNGTNAQRWTKVLKP